MSEQGKPSGHGTDLTTVKEKQEGMGTRQDELQMGVQISEQLRQIERQSLKICLSRIPHS